MPFSGFADAKFFQRLAKIQDRAWFKAHQEEFELGFQAPMKELLAEVRAGIDRAYRHCELDQPKVLRIFRDVRFSKDKSPYKTNIAGLIPINRRGNVTEVPMALYFHVGLPNSFAAAGHYMMDARSLERYRAAVADDQRGKELTKLLGALTKKGFVVRSYDAYKRMPKGYDTAHVRAEHLLRKGLTVTFPELPRAILASPKLSAWLISQAKLAAPLVEWLTFATH
ncbi:MAG TPA: DUF2461 domain-containing protein [Polyangiaceae bacterium]|nr:DUF2461 domain-containing protein [Polyangiaceae bacterium]